MFKNNKIGLILAILASLCAISACALTDGKDSSDDDYGYFKCSNDDDCNDDGYCNPAGLCANDCRKTADCALFGDYKWECLKGKCLVACAEEDDGSFSCERGKCDSDNAYCIYECSDDSGCSKYGKDLVCEDFECINKSGVVDGDEEPAVDGDEEAEVDGDEEADSGPVEIGLKCHYRTPEECDELHWHPNCKDDACWKMGFQMECREDGECIDTGSVDFGEVDDTKNASKYVGVYAEMFTTAASTIGIEGLGEQKTVTAHHNLVRVIQQGNDIIVQHKGCKMVMYNFADDVCVIGIDDVLGGINIPETYWENVAVINHTFTDVPEMVAGNELTSDFVTEVRGAKLEDWENGVLPNREMWQKELDGTVDPPVTWDQDYDGKPGMTTGMKSVIATGSIYSTQRWGCGLNAKVVDENRFEGILSHANEQYQIDAEPAQLIYPDTHSKSYEGDDTRSYFRLMRIADDATCADVLTYTEQGCPELATKEPNGEGQYACFSVHLDGGNDTEDREEEKK